MPNSLIQYFTQEAKRLRREASAMERRDPVNMAVLIARYRRDADQMEAEVAGAQ